MKRPKQERVSILKPKVKKGQDWAPVVGSETISLFEGFRLDPESQKRVREGAHAVLARSKSPKSAPGAETGLVVGYVQSGKTMSFTTVAALARDNEFQLIIVIAGTSVYLLQQSTDRLINDLRLNQRKDRVWLHFQSSKLKDPDRISIRDALAAWTDPTMPKGAQSTVLVTAMKHHKHLDKLSDVLERLDLSHVRALVIDDEADQASLNSKVNKGEQSTTYEKIARLRRCLPHHTFLQYTATPQAPLLINIIDTLSPRFVEVLSPGDDYVGGKHFFLKNPELVIEIPEDEISTGKKELEEPPQSLLDAMRLFFVGVAAELVLSEGRGNRSMMVHPSQAVASHDRYFQWVTATRESWNSLLDLKYGKSPDQKELLAEFREAFNSLKKTAKGLPTWERVVGRLHHAVRQTRIEKINATQGASDEVKWNSSFAFILVGGQAMDRGFTVEGLTVTYMPRGVGVGNADTIQQRGRFFGYKRRYLGYCRVFLDSGAKKAFANYVRHEEDVRTRLLKHQATGEPLFEWKRRFVLDKDLKPTRRSVLDLDYIRGRSEASWFSNSRPHADRNIARENYRIIEEFSKRLGSKFKPDRGHKGRTDTQRHLEADVPLRYLLEELLSKIKLADPKDSQEFTFLTIMLAEILDRDTNRMCTVQLMSSWVSRQRGVTKSGEIKNLFQGEAPVYPKSKQGSVYPGDKGVAESKRSIVLQAHRLDLTGGSSRKVFVKNVPAFAVYVAQGLSPDLLVQEENPDS